MPARKVKRKPSLKVQKPASMLHARLARAIGEGILSGTYAPGTLLPNEADWGRMFGVSRTAVREAIKTLNGKGLLVSRPKIGSRVEPRERWNLLDRDVLGWHCAAMDRRAFLESTQEARKLLETGIAGLAAIKHTPEQLAKLRAALEDMRAAKSAADMVEPDVRFHLALLAAANNDLLAPFGIVIEQALGNLFDYTTRHNPKPDFVIPLHEEVVSAVAMRDAEAARAAVTRLLDDTDNIIAAEPKPAKKLKGQLVP
jgi:DNA-binding FadR family transcriptional regulator